MTLPPDKATADGRDETGRFAPGNPGGPGRPRSRSSELRRAAEQAVSPQHIDALMRRALRMGLEGDLKAMRFVMERVCGRAAEAPVETEPIGIMLPPMRTATDCIVALEHVTEGLCKGTVDRDAAKVLIDAIQTRLKAIELNVVEERLAELEKTVGTVAPNGARNIRRI